MTNIDEARKRLKLIALQVPEHTNAFMVNDICAVLDALDAAERDRAYETEQKLKLAAVIERAKSLPTYSVWQESQQEAWSAVDYDDLASTLSAVPADVLRERDAEKWDECVSEAFSLGWLNEFDRDDLEARNPYRETKEQGR